MLPSSQRSGVGEPGGEELGIEKIPELRVSLERGREGKECADWRGQKRIKKKDEE